MTEYTFRVIETHAVEYTYTVEAGSPEEARGKAECGDTVDECLHRDRGVLNREIDDG